MRARKGQSSLEYVVVLAALLLILASIYSLSVDLEYRRGLLASQMEGERVAARLSRALDAVSIAGPGAQETLPLYSTPNQTVIAYGAEVLSRGPFNRTLAVVRTLGNLTTSLTNFSTNQDVLVNYSGTDIVITALG